MATSFIIHSSSTFEKDLNRLARKYPQIRNDIQEALAKVQSSNIIGSAIPGGKGKLYKLKVASSDLRRGKSGGFRVVFYLQAPNDLWPIICYFKGEMENVPVRDLEVRAKDLGLNI